MTRVALMLSTVLAALLLCGTEAAAVPAGQPCGSLAGNVCDKGLWCEPPAGVCTSTTGVCVAIPRLCFVRKKGKSFKPVCGCNSKTYSSDCFRRAYKIGKFHDGKCDTVSANHSGT